MFDALSQWIGEWICASYSLEPGKARREGTVFHDDVPRISMAPNSSSERVKAVSICMSQSFPSRKTREADER
jgi:hypothetical protein